MKRSILVLMALVTVSYLTLAQGQGKGKEQKEEKGKKEMMEGKENGKGQAEAKKGEMKEKGAQMKEQGDEPQMDGTIKEDSGKGMKKAGEGKGNVFSLASLSGGRMGDVSHPVLVDLLHRDHRGAHRLPSRCVHQQGRVPCNHAEVHLGGGCGPRNQVVLCGQCSIGTHCQSWTDESESS